MRNNLGFKSIISLFLAAIMLFATMSFNVLAGEEEITPSAVVLPALSLNTSSNTIVDDGTFDVFGDIGIENASGYDYMVALELRNKSTGAVVQELSNADFPATDGSYSFEGCSFPSTYQGGTYIVEVTLLDLLNGYVVLDTVQKEIAYSKTPVIVVPDNIVISSLGGTANATYNLYGTLPRITGGNNITITGRATKGGVGVANAEIRIGVYNPSWSASSPNRDKNIIVTTDANGNFSGTFATSKGVGTYNQVVTVSKHYFDLALAYAEYASNPQAAVVEKYIYVFAYSM